MAAIPTQLVHGLKLYLLDFDGVITTEAEDVALKAQTLSVFAAVAKRFDERAIKMVRLAGHAIYNAGGSVQLGPLLYHAADLLKPPEEPVEPTLAKLIDACVGNIDYRGLGPAPPVVHEGLRRIKARGIRIAILTNGVRQSVFKVLEKKGLTDICPREHIFDAISTRGETGKLHPKPDPEGCRRVLDELHADAGDCVFVDNSRKNVRAAKREVGCRGVVYIGNRRKPKDLGIIDHQSPTFAALMGEIVAALGPGS